MITPMRSHDQTDALQGLRDLPMTKISGTDRVSVSAIQLLGASPGGVLMMSSAPHRGLNVPPVRADTHGDEHEIVRQVATWL